MRYHTTKMVRLSLLVSLLAACASSPPASVADICDIFEDRRGWYNAAKSAERRWGIPVSVNMAFIYQESSFQSRARPPRNKFLWIFPGRRPSSAFGYAQVLDETWQEYEQKSGNSRASRANFSDAIDFVSWYNANSTRVSNITMRCTCIMPTTRVTAAINAQLTVKSSGWWIPPLACRRIQAVLQHS